MVTDIGSGVYRMIKTIKEQLNKDVVLEQTETEFIVSIPRIWVNMNYETTRTIISGTQTHKQNLPGWRTERGS